MDRRGLRWAFLLVALGCATPSGGPAPDGGIFVRADGAADDQDEQPLEELPLECDEAALEACNAEDDDCDGAIDEGGACGADAEVGWDPNATACSTEPCQGPRCQGFEADADLAPRDIRRRHAPATVTPEPPLLHPTLRLGARERYVHPTIPAHRTTFDGRVAILRGVGPTGRAIAALRARRLADGPLVHQETQIGAELFSSGAGRAPIEPLIHPAIRDAHPRADLRQGAAFLCMPNLQQPRACGEGDDCYDLVLIQDIRDEDRDRLWLQSVPLRVRVNNPKTRNASIDRVVIAPKSEWRRSDVIRFDELAELVVTADGRMLSGRILFGADNPDKTLNFRTDAGAAHAGRYSLFYAYSQEPCDVRAWAARNADGVFRSLRPITAAPFDRRLKTADGRARYGIAAYPMRDALGNELGETDLLSGAYPWMDRDGNNLFFTTIKPAILAADGSGVTGVRFPVERASGALAEPVSPARGLAVIGAWTHGKAVLLDGLLNNEDYGFAADENHWLSLYQRPGGQAIAVRVNGGGKPGVGGLDIPDARNNNLHVESLENVLYAHTGSLPVTPRDVVWNITRGLATDEVAFDDLLDPHVVLLAEMNAAWRNGTTPRNGRYLDGFGRTDGVFTHDASGIRLQNAATTLRYPMPRSGRIEGDARIEPVALGGIRGRGLWLEGDARASFGVPAGAGYEGLGFYAGVFVDPRGALAGGRHLFSVARESGERAAVVIHPRAVAVTYAGHRIRASMPCGHPWMQGGWHSVGVLFAQDGEVTIFIDGNPIGGGRLEAAPELGQGAIELGGALDGHAGVRGWLDELRVVVSTAGEQLEQTASVELLCNYARGTMAGLSEDAPRYRLAGLLPVTADRAERLGVRPGAGRRAYCYTDYRGQYRVGRGRLPDGARSLRDAILREGDAPLRYDAPRPDTRGNSFCTTCHVTTGEDPYRPRELRLSALRAIDANAEDDARVQPMQPWSRPGRPPTVRGHIPADWIRGGDGTRYPANHRLGPRPIFRWLLR